MSGAIVLALYRPKEGKEAALLDLLRGHVPLLRKEGLATDRPVLLLKSREDGTLIEIFEWTSSAAADQAHSNPRVREVWSAMGEVADFGPLSQLAETARPFPHFDPLDGVVT